MTEKKIRTKKDLRTFAIGILIITGAIAGILCWQDKPTAALVLACFSAYGLIGTLIPISITPLFIVFSFIALILGWINTRLLLGLLYYLVFAPLGSIMRLFGKDPLIRKMEPDRTSYWEPVSEEKADPKHLHKQF